MRLIGIDPGKTTGVVVVDTNMNEVSILYTDEVYMEPSGFRAYNELLSTVSQFKPDTMVIESVVLHGPFNRDKFDQSKAFMQAYLAANTPIVGVFPSPSVAEITPEFRKRASLSLPVRALIKGGHARDAFDVVIAYLHQYHKEVWVNLRRGNTKSKN